MENNWVEKQRKNATQSAGRSFFSLNSVWYCFPPGHWDAFFPLMNFLHPRWNTDSADNLLRKAPVSCEEFSVQQGIYMWKSYMGIGKHLIKRMTTWSAAVIYVHSLLIKKYVFRPIFYIFFIAAQQGTLNCSCLTSWLSLVCFLEKKKAKPSTLCFQLRRLFICERCNKDAFLHWRMLK